MMRNLALLLALLPIANGYYQPISQVSIALPYLGYATSHQPFDMSRGSLAGLLGSMRAAVVQSIGIRFVPPDFTMIERKGQVSPLHCVESGDSLCTSTQSSESPIASVVFPTSGSVQTQDPSTNRSFATSLHWDRLVADSCHSVDGAYRHRAIVSANSSAPRYDISACDVTSGKWTVIFDPVQRTVSVHR